MRAEEHHDAADHAEQHMEERPRIEVAVRRFQDIVEQALHAASENICFPALGMITLHHANTAERFRQPASDLSVDLAALAKYRTNGAEGVCRLSAEDDKNPKASTVIGDADVEEPDQSATPPSASLRQIQPGRCR